MTKRIRLTVPKQPDYRIDKGYSDDHGGALVAGIDEAGRGPLAGPVVAAAVILNPNGDHPTGLNDSKKLKEKDRDRLFEEVQEKALAFGIGIATAEEIDSINILQATLLAARRAMEKLSPSPGVLVTDCLSFAEETRPVYPLIKGDAISPSIAAASILAKVTRDRMMAHYHEEFPEYRWAENKGYPTKSHLASLLEHGPSSLHRLTFKGVMFFDSTVRRSPSFQRLIDEIEACAGSHDGESWQRIRQRIQEAAHRLPPTDHQLLMQKLPQQERELHR